MAGAKLISKALQAAREAFSGRNVSPLGFYSKGAEEAAALRQAKGTPEQMRSMLINKQGVKATELDNAGFNDAFAGRPSVTREEIAKLLQDRAPKIEERVLGKQAESAAKHSAYQLPGGENYREVVLKLPAIQSDPPVVDKKGGSYGFTDANGQRRDYWSQQEAEQAARSAYRGSGSYTSSHWDDPNVLAHLRMSDRTDPTGRKILHLEELQSDWAQEGRKKGFLDPQIDQSSTRTLYDAAKIEITKLMKIASDRLGQENPRYDDAVRAVPELGFAYVRLGMAARAWAANSGVPTAPYVTKTQDWTDLALKRALREAAEGNYDAIAWTPGKTQAARYPGGTPEDEAKRLKGMIGYYDKMVPTQFQKLARDLDPNVAIERMRIPVQGQNTSAEDIARQLNMSVDQVAALPIDQKLQLIGSVRNTMELPSLTVTPEMREKIKQGLPLFTAPAVGLGAASQMQSGETPVTDEPRLDFAGGGGARKTPVTDESTPTVPKMDDYTLFSRRRLVPYGQSYAPTTSGRFEQGNMRIKQMQRAQEQAERSAPVPNMADDYTLFSPRRLVPYGQSYAPNRSAYAPNRTGRFFKGMMTNPIKFTPQGSQSTRQEQERMLMQARRLQEQATSGADFTPPDWEDNRPVKFVNRAAPVSRAVNTQQRVELPSWIAPAGLKVAPFNIGDRNSPTLPSFAYADRLEQSAPQSAGERAIAIAKGLPQQVYRAVTNPVETAKAVANAVLSGEDYQSSGEPVVQNGVINWGDPDNPADFFRADQALQELHPYVEPETPPEPANEGYSNGGIVSELLNEVVDFVNPGFAGGGEVGGEYDYVEPEMVYDDEYDYVEPETVYDDEYDYVEPEMAEDLDGFAHGGPALMQDEYPTEYLPEVGRQVMAGGGEVDNPIVDEAYGEPMSDRARMRQTVANIAPREGEEVKADGEGWQRTLQNYRNFPVRPGEATMRPADLSPRDKIAQAISGDGTSYGSELRKRAANLLVGSRGLPDTGLGIGVADLPMVTGIPLNIADISDAASKGRYGEAALGAALPAAFWARKPIGAALRTARDVIASPVGRTSAAGATGAAVMSPDDAEAANILKAVKGSFKGLFPSEVGARYPVIGPPELKIDPKKGKEYLSKVLSPEAELVQKARIAAQKDISSGNYSPFFPPDKRFDVDASNYPAYSSTIDIIAKKPETVAKFEALAGSPEARERLVSAYRRGMENKELAENWYFMGQLEKAFTDTYGPKVGREMFKERFADAMAATTGGADPTSNLMMAHYGNYLKNAGSSAMPPSYEMPFPIGGRYVTGNMDQFRKMIMGGAGITKDNPKRYNFSNNFTGSTGPTIDEQMSGLFRSGLGMPEAGRYGHYEEVLADLAKKEGAPSPRYFQEVAWAGGKDAKTPGGFKGNPMINIVNEAIERTRRITGKDPAEIVERGLVKSEIPLYAHGGPVEEYTSEIGSPLPEPSKY
jgi:hypothetical protein